MDGRVLVKERGLSHFRYTVLCGYWCGVFFMNIGKEPSALGSLRFLTGPLAGNTYPITKAITTLGRDPSNDIVISDPS